MTIPPTSSSAAADTLFQGAMPKEETGALKLLQKHPTFDGRGCVVAIFDTGVDPAAAGLATTTDGKPKVLDVVDCSGSGDVLMKPPVQAVDGKLQGLYGRELILNPAWKNPKGEWRVGAKGLYDIYPGGCKKRIKEKRKERWLEKQREAVAAAVGALTATEANKSATADEKAEAAAKCELLKGHADAYNDAGPMLHCVVWHDGDAWRAALDSSDLFEPGSCEGLLENFEPMTNFRAERQYSTFSALDACNFALNIYNDGGTLSIVTDTGAHGTHVAGITAANHPDSPALNGVAPGAQIVSCKIGDTRVSGMETGPGLVRALSATLENGVDVINMSYGEPTMTPNLGRFVELANEMVYDKNVIFVASAGNNGPGLTTVGAPGGTSSCVLSVGAYVSPALSAAGHSVRKESHPEGWEGQQYNWSSRGPTADGEIGVSICAPGGAVAPVPQWVQQARQLMNGTSMSSPNACGCVALLVSAMKQLGQPVSQNRIRRAVENTALELHEKPEDKLAYGCGLMQVHSALDYLMKSEDADKPDIRYEVKVRRSDSQRRRRGIYLRDPSDLDATSTHTVTLKPHLHRDADVRKEKLAVEDKLLLRSSAPWLSAPTQLLLPHNGRDFDVRVDPSGLSPGLHFAEVAAMDAGAEWRGPLARLPVTVCVPVAPADSAPGPRSRHSLTIGPMDFIPGREHRHYVGVPLGATWAEMTVRAGAHDAPKLFMLHTTQLLPHKRPLQSRSAPSLTSEAVVTSSFPVHGGVGLEMALAQFWKSEGPAQLTVDLSFHGASIGNERVTIEGPDVAAPFTVHAPLCRTKLILKGTLATLRIPLRPTDSQIRPQQGRGDTLPSGRIMHQLLLTYTFKLLEGGSITPVLPPFQAAVYDGALEGQTYAVYDANKKRVGFSDVYPSAITLKKGEYTIHVSLRHDDVAVLQKFSDLPMRVDKTLDSELTVPIHTRLANALTDGKPAKDVFLRQGERATFFVGPVPQDGLPKDAKPGCTLHGALKVGKTTAAAGDKAAPDAAELLFTVLPKKREKESSDDDKGGDEEKTPAEALKEAKRDAHVKILKDMKLKSEADAEAYREFLDSLVKEWPEHLPIRMEALARASEKLKKAKEDDAERGGKIDAVVATAKDVLALVNEVSVAQFVASKAKPETPKEKRVAKAMTEEKDALLEALHARARAELRRAEADGWRDEAVIDGFEEAYKALRNWVDITAPDYVHIYAAREQSQGRVANAVKALDKVLNDKDKLPSRELLEQKTGLLRKLGWEHWARLHESEVVHSFPDDFAAI